MRTSMDQLDASVVESRLDRMIEIARSEGLSLDRVVEQLGACDQRRFEELSLNPSRLPR